MSDNAHLASAFAEQRSHYRRAGALLFSLALVLASGAAVLVAYGEDSDTPAFYALGALTLVGTAAGCVLRALGHCSEARSLTRSIKQLREEVRL